MTDQDKALLQVLFTEARSQNRWTDALVSDDQLRAAYEVAKWGPTSMNTQPMRLLFLRSADAKERLAAAVAPANVAKVVTAPVVAIVCHDLDFAEQMAKTFPHNPGARGMFDQNPDLRQATAFRNGSLQAAYFMLALRSVGLDVGPMSGFNPGQVEKEFLAGRNWQVNMLCSIGHGDPAGVMPRLPRLEFEEVSETL